MKKKLLMFGFLTIICISQTVYAQKIYVFKPWHCSLSAAAGPNFSGMDLSGTLASQIATSNFGLFGGFTYGKEKLNIIDDHKENVHSSFIEIGAKYSFYSVIVPVPVNIEPFLGLSNCWENGDLIDGTKVENKTVGNSFGINVEFFMFNHFSLIFKQNCHYLYNSSFGNFRTASLIGVNVMF